MDEFDEQVKEAMKKSLSDSEITDYLDGKCKILTYEQLCDYDNIFDAMGPYEALVLLYLTRERYGHWCCCFTQDNSIVFFDSYSAIPDDELDYIPKKVRDRFCENYPHLTKLLYESERPIEYNEFVLQAKGNGISTCGRWTCVRLKYRDIPTSNFAKLFRGQTESPDWIVTALTIDI